MLLSRGRCWKMGGIQCLFEIRFARFEVNSLIAATLHHKEDRKGKRSRSRRRRCGVKGYVSCAAKTHS